MQCPLCFSVMECRTPAQNNQADFHCFNDDCDSKNINYRPHIGVVLSKAPTPHRCISYHLPFKEYDGTWLILEGDIQSRTTTLYERNSFVMSEKVPFDDVNDNPTPGFMTVKDNATIWDMGLMVSVNQFMRLPIDDKTHVNAKDIFKTINNLELYVDYSETYSTHYSGPHYKPFSGIQAAKDKETNETKAKETKNVVSISPAMTLSEMGYLQNWD